MIRRNFLAAGLAAGASLLAPSARGQSNAPKFKLKYGPHPGMFRHSAGEDIIDQINFSAGQGFTGWEDNRVMRQSPDMQKKIGDTLQKRGMTMGVFVSFGEFSSSDFVTRTDKEYQDELRAKMRLAVETQERVGATWTTVVPNAVNQKLDMGFQTANCITNLRVMAEVCEPTGLVMVLEPPIGTPITRACFCAACRRLMRFARASIPRAARFSTTSITSRSTSAT